MIKIFSLAILFNLTLCQPALAADVSSEDYWGGTQAYNRVQSGILLENNDPRLIVGSIINIILGFLGIIFLALTLYAGFMWMTSIGNEEKITQAKKIMTGAIIGLIIILAAFGIARFVISALIKATGAS